MNTAPTVSRPTGASRCTTPERRLMRYASRSRVRSFTAIERPSGREARRLRYSTASCADAVDATSTRTQAMPRMARMLARPYARPFAIAIRDLPETACFFPECLLTPSGLSPLKGFDSVPTVQLRFWFRCRSVTTTRTATTTAARACGVARDLGSAVSTRTTTSSPAHRRGFCFYGLLKTERPDSRGHPGRRHVGSPDGRLHERRSARANSQHPLRDLLQPDAKQALDEGRDIGEPSGRHGHPRRLRQRHRAGEGETAG